MKNSIVKCSKLVPRSRPSMPPYICGNFHVSSSLLWVNDGECKLLAVGVGVSCLVEQNVKDEDRLLLMPYLWQLVEDKVETNRSKQIVWLGYFHYGIWYSHPHMSPDPFRVTRPLILVQGTWSNSCRLIEVQKPTTAATNIHNPWG